MVTFQQYLENLRTWNTRDPQADINVTADYSDDENDASHFLLPFMRKIKAFAWYCWVACNELSDDLYRWHGTTDDVYGKRVAALQGLVGYDSSRSEDHPFRDAMHSVAWQMNYFHDILHIKVTGETDEDIEKVLNELLLRIDVALHRDGVLKIKNKLVRMREFLLKSKDQLLRVMGFKVSKSNPLDFYGRRR